MPGSQRSQPGDWLEKGISNVFDITIVIVTNQILVGCCVCRPVAPWPGGPGGAMAPPEKNLSDDFDACRKF